MRQLYGNCSGFERISKAGYFLRIMKQAVLSLSAAVLVGAAMMTSCASQAAAERPAARQRAVSEAETSQRAGSESHNAQGSVVLAAAPAMANPNPAAAPAAAQGAKGDAAKGKETFEQCGICHNVDSEEEKMGPSLKGLFKKAKLKNGKAASEENIRAIVKAGGNGMPGYEELLSAEEFDNLIAYLKTV
jgi:cytochrome c